MVGNDKSFGLGHSLLALLNFWVIKLFYPSTIETDHVVVVLTFIELIDSLTAFKMVAVQNTGLLKLGQHPVDRGQTDVGIFVEQLLVNVFCGHVPQTTALKNVEDFHAWDRGFESAAFEFFDLDHGVSGLLVETAEFGSSRYNV
jgi:hypothetical protein